MTTKRTNLTVKFGQTERQDTDSKLVSATSSVMFRCAFHHASKITINCDSTKSDTDRVSSLSICNICIVCNLVEFFKRYYTFTIIANHTVLIFYQALVSTI